MNDKHKSNELPDWLQKKLHYWFVQYNPLYFFSALCVLFGMFLFSRGLGQMGWKEGQLLLTAVSQLYEILLIIGAGLLFRVAGQFRPAVILGLIEVFFLLDCTFRIELMTTLGGLGVVATVAWVYLVAIKLNLLVWVFRLKVSAAAIVIPILAAIGLAGVPHVFELYRLDQELVHLGAVWYGVALMALVKFLRPKVDCALPLDDWSQTVLRRSTKAALAMWTGVYVFHLFAWKNVFGIPFTLAQTAPLLLLVCVLLEKEVWIWAGGLAVLLLTMKFPSAITPTALVVGMVYGLQGRQKSRPRFYLGMVVYFYFALWAMSWKGGPLPEPKLWLMLTTTLLLIVMAWTWRLPSAIPATILVMLPGGGVVIPQGTLQWGAFALVIGFASLIAGVAASWTLGGSSPDDEEIILMEEKVNRLTEP
jgi:hypothetical protein